jgi:hypothetical protein
MLPRLVRGIHSSAWIGSRGQAAGRRKSEQAAGRRSELGYNYSAGINISLEPLDSIGPTNPAFSIVSTKRAARL